MANLANQYPSFSGILPVSRRDNGQNHPCDQLHLGLLDASTHPKLAFNLESRQIAEKLGCAVGIDHRP